MPFTFCHPAIILPFLALKSRWFSATALFVGAMSPDLEYFTRMKIMASIGHDWICGLVLCLPLGLLYCFVYHLLVRNLLIEHLPKYFRERFEIYKDFQWVTFFKKNSIIVIISFIIGFYSHLFWDAFTHEWGFFVRLIPFLKTELLEIPLYKILQHFSTLMGGLVLLVFVHQLPTHPIVSKKFDFVFWLKIVGISFGIITIRFLIHSNDIRFGNLLVTGIMGGFIGLIILAFRPRKYS